jgi:hypothetical protein
MRHPFAVRLIALGLVLSCAHSQAHAGCSLALTYDIVSAERVVDSLRPDKAGQARVFAYDGTVYTAGEAQWMKAQLREVLSACAQNDDQRAAPHLQSVLGLLKARHSQL